MASQALKSSESSRAEKSSDGSRAEKSSDGSRTETRWALVWLAAAVAYGCRGGATPEARPPAAVSRAQSVSVVMPVRDTGGAAVAQPVQGMPRLSAVLDDPRLSAARERAEARDDAAAAREVERVMATLASPDAHTVCQWSYLAGRFHLSAGETNEAAAAFERTAGSEADSGGGCVLAPYARLRQAEALIRAGRCDEALACTQRLGDDLSQRDEAKLTMADALSCKGDRAGAVAIWRSVLASSPHGLHWVDTSIQLATALLDGVDGSPQACAAEALERINRVLIDAPSAADKLDAAGLRLRAAGLARAPLKAVLTPEERARQVQAYLDASQSRHAREAADDFLATIPKTSSTHHGIACNVAIARAQATPHGKTEEAEKAWGVAIARCSGEDALVTALYYGARASASLRHDSEAFARFEKVEKLFPKHRLADDARFRAALVLQDKGEISRATAMLLSIADTYPDGDMGGEALFRVAVGKLEKHDLDGARTLLDRLLAIISNAPAAQHRADYFRARVAEQSGEIDDAKTRYAALIAAAPLDYYMLLAYARLRGIDDALARSSLEAAVTREEPGPLVTGDHVEFATPAFERFVRLLEVGEFDSARREANAGGLMADSVDPQVLWAIAWLYDRAGAADLGHSLARGRLSEFRTHYPTGRWRLAWEIAFPRAWDDVVTRESDARGIPAPLTWAVMREESAFNPDAKSVASAIGLMQLMSGTARLVAKDAQLPCDEQNLHRPDVSISLGTRLLSSLRVSFPLHPAFAIAAYNGGSAAVRRWLIEHGADDFDVFVERIPFDETRNYVKKVLSSEAAYAYLYEPAALDEILSMPDHLTAPQTVATP